MPVTIPAWSEPIFDFYNLRWPDIDEDAVTELGSRIQTFGGVPWLFGLRVYRHLQDLADVSESEALDAFATQWRKACNDFLKPISDASDQAPQIFAAAGNSIYGYKHGILGILTAQVGATVASGGLSAIATKAVAREALESAMEALAQEIQGQITNVIRAQIESQIVAPIIQWVELTIRAASTELTNVAVSKVPNVGTSGSVRRLGVDLDAIESAVAKIKPEIDFLVNGVQALLSYHSASSYSTPTPNADIHLRTLLRPILDAALSEISAAITNLGNSVLEKLTGGIRDIYSKLQEADRILAEVAQGTTQQVASIGPSVSEAQRRSVANVHVERAGAPVVTGPAQSERSKSVAPIQVNGAEVPHVTPPSTIERSAAPFKRD